MVDIELDERQRRTWWIVMAYPWVLVLIAGAIDVFFLHVAPAVVALPSPALLRPLVIAAAMLLLNHSWLMTATELTRLRYRLYATPEEWTQSGLRRADAAPLALQELERAHNCHRNATENTVYFVLLALVFALLSPSALAAWVLLLAFPLARLGHTASYLGGRDGLRGASMTLSLLSLYGMAIYLLIALFI